MKMSLSLVALAVAVVFTIAGCGGSAEKAAKKELEKAGVTQAKGVTAEDLGVPSYPGAKVVPPGAVETGGATSMTLETGDSLDKVRDFYAEKLQGKATPMDLERGKSVIFQMDDDDARVAITLAADADRVLITISRTKK